MALLAALATIPASAFGQASFYLECPTTRVTEGGSVTVNLVSVGADNTKEFGATFDTVAGTAGTSDFVHLGNGKFSGWKRNTNANEDRLAFTVETREDTLWESDETFTIQFRTTNITPGRSNKCVLTIADNDPATRVSKSSLTIDEGSSDTYTVVLGNTPTANVTVTPTSSATSTATVSPSKLTFTAQNWNTPQAFTVKGVNDNVSGTPDRSATITHRISGGGYNSATVPSVTVTVKDDPRGVTASKSAVTVSEAPGQRKTTYTVKLNSKPTGKVTVIPIVSDPGVVRVSTASDWDDLTFTPTNWNRPQTLTVTAVDDDFIDPVRRATITHRARGGGYDSKTPTPTVSVTVTNDDSPAVIVFADTHFLRSPRVVVRENETALYRIKLAKGPLSDVTLTMASANAAIATAEPVKFVDALTFTRQNWDTAQEVLVSGVNDDVVNPEVAGESGNNRGRTTRIRHQASGGGYGGVSVDDAPVFVRDDEGQRFGPRPASSLSRVPRNAAISSTGVVTWDLDTETDRDSILPYSVEWIADEQPPSRMNARSSAYDYVSVEESACYDSGSCEVRIGDFDAGLHYLVHVNTVPRDAEDMPPIVLRHTAAGAATTSTGLPTNVTVSGAGLIAWGIPSGQDDDALYAVEWAWGDHRLETVDSEDAEGENSEEVRADSCADLRCELQIGDFDPEKHYVVEVNSLDRVMDGLDPVRARHTPGAANAGSGSGGATGNDGGGGGQGNTGGGGNDGGGGQGNTGGGGNDGGGGQGNTGGGGGNSGGGNSGVGGGNSGVGGGNSGGSGSTATIANAPENLRALAGNSQVTLSWDAPGDDGGAAIAGYQYRLGESGADPGAWIDIPESGPGEANEGSYTVTELTNGLEYVFHVRAVNAHGGGLPAEATVTLPSVVRAESEELPTEAALLGNYPNPFNPQTRIDYALPSAVHVRLAVYDVQGRQVRILENGLRPAGRHTAAFDAAGLPGGVYVYRLETAEGIVSKAAILVK